MHHPDGPRPTVPTRRRLPEAPTPRASRRSFACLNSTAGLTSRLQLRTSSTAIFHLPDRVAWTNKGRKWSLSAVTLMPRAAYRPSFRGSPSSHCTSIRSGPPTMDCMDISARRSVSRRENFNFKGLRYPLHCQFLALSRAVEKIKVNQLLVRESCLIRQPLEIVHDFRT